MGCDIHLYTEVLEDGSWRPLLPPAQSTHWDPANYDSPEDAERYRIDLPQTFGDRNYGLFAILAGVRNGSGFAGTDLGDPTIPITEPRGVPDDASADYRREVEQWGGDGHSHSWLSLADVYAHDWEGSKSVNRSQVRHRRVHGKPADFSDIGSHHKIATDDAFARKMQELAQYFGNEVYDIGGRAWGAEFCGWSSEGVAGGWRGIQWETSHLDQAGPGWLRFVFKTAREAHLRALPADQIRFVFFFDN